MKHFLSAMILAVAACYPGGVNADVTPKRSAKDLKKFSNPKDCPKNFRLSERISVVHAKSGNVDCMGELEPKGPTLLYWTLFLSKHDGEWKPEKLWHLTDRAPGEPFPYQDEYKRIIRKNPKFKTLLINESVDSKRDRSFVPQRTNTLLFDRNTGKISEIRLDFSDDVMGAPIKMDEVRLSISEDEKVDHFYRYQEDRDDTSKTRKKYGLFLSIKSGVKIKKIQIEKLDSKDKSANSDILCEFESNQINLVDTSWTDSYRIRHSEMQIKMNGILVGVATSQTRYGAYAPFYTKVDWFGAPKDRIPVQVVAHECLTTTADEIWTTDLESRSNALEKSWRKLLTPVPYSNNGSNMSKTPAVNRQKAAAAGSVR